MVDLSPDDEGARTPRAAVPPEVDSAQAADVGDEVELLTEEEEEDLTAAEHETQQVVYSGQDFDVAGLVGRLVRSDVLIPTFGHDDPRIVTKGFQRSFVWTRRQMDRFVESLLLGYPIPGIFLVRQADKRYLVLDGQQRLSTLRAFVEGVHDGKEFSLKNVADKFVGLTYKKLSGELRRAFDDTFIQATIVSSDGSSYSLESIYKIFERLNSGGTQLTPHEIRVALYAGPLIDFIEILNSGVEWRTLYGKRSKRLRDQELVLRIVALYSSAVTYARPLKTFLNRFAGEHRDLKKLNKELVSAHFQEAIQILEPIGPSAFRHGSGQVNAALAEVTTVGLMRRLDAGGLPDVSRVRVAIATLAEDKAFIFAIGRATADEEQLRTRLEKATAAFAGT
jgi:hypothetical protein